MTAEGLGPEAVEVPKGLQHSVCSARGWSHDAPRPSPSPGVPSAWTQVLGGNSGGVYGSGQRSVFLSDTGETWQHPEFPAAWGASGTGLGSTHPFCNCCTSRRAWKVVPAFRLGSDHQETRNALSVLKLIFF